MSWYGDWLVDEMIEQQDEQLDWLEETKEEEKDQYIVARFTWTKERVSKATQQKTISSGVGCWMLGSKEMLQRMVSIFNSKRFSQEDAIYSYEVWENKEKDLDFCRELVKLH